MNASETKRARLESLQSIINNHRKSEGPVFLGWGKEMSPVKRLPFGLKPLNILTLGGIPRGMWTVFAGPEMAGKTTVAMDLIAKTQKDGGICCYINTEGTFDANSEWSLSHGIVPDELLVIEHGWAEEMLDLVKPIMKSDAVDLIVLDSITAASPRGEHETKTGKERSLEDDTVALQARLNSQFFRMMTPLLSKGKIACILIAQIREKIDLYGGIVIPGGHAMKHYAAMRLMFRRKSTSEWPSRVVNGKHVYTGFKSSITLDKTKLGGNEKDSQDIEFIFGSGFDPSASIISMCVQRGIIGRKGAWFSYGDLKWQGLNKLAEEYKGNKKLRNSIDKELSALDEADAGVGI